MASTNTLHLFMRDREKIIINSDIQTLTGVNEKGVFDILPLHSNFITLIEQHVLLTRTDGTKQEVTVNNGILRVIENRVEIYVGVHK